MSSKLVGRWIETQRAVGVLAIERFEHTNTEQQGTGYLTSRWVKTQVRRVYERGDKKVKEEK